MKVEYKKLILYMLFFLYPVLPSYFGFAGWPVYTILGAVASALLIVANRKIVLYKETLYLLFAYLCLLMPAMRHQEMVSVLFFLVDVSLILGCICNIKNRQTIETIIDIMIIAAAILCVCSYIEVLLDFNVFSIIENIDSVGGMGTDAQYRFSYRRAEASFSQSIGYAIYLTFISSLNFYKICTNKRKNRYLIYHVMIIIGVILTFSRVSMILFFSLQLYFMYIKGFYKGVKKTIEIIAAVILFVLIASIFHIEISFLNDAISMIVAMFDSETSSKIAGSFGNDNLNGWSYRLVLITELPRLLGNKWLLGGGQVFANSGFYTSLYKVGSIDNNYMTVLFRYGLLGVVGKMTYIFTGISSSKKLSREEDYKAIIFGKISCATFIVYLLNWISVAELRESRTVLMYIIICVAYENVTKCIRNV